MWPGSAPRGASRHVRTGQDFDIDLTCKLTPAYYLILNQFEWVFPKPTLIQAVDYGRDIVTRIIHITGCTLYQSLPQRLRHAVRTSAFDMTASTSR